MPCPLGQDPCKKNFCVLTEIELANHLPGTVNSCALRSCPDFFRGLPDSDGKAGQATPEVPAPGQAKQTRVPGRAHAGEGCAPGYLQEKWDHLNVPALWSQTGCSSQTSVDCWMEVLLEIGCPQHFTHAPFPLEGPAALTDCAHGI